MSHSLCRAYYIQKPLLKLFLEPIDTRSEVDTDGVIQTKIISVFA